MNYIKTFTVSFDNQRIFHKENAFSHFEPFRCHISNGKIKQGTVVNFLSSIDAFLDCNLKLTTKEWLENDSNSKIGITHDDFLEQVERNLIKNLPSYIKVVPSFDWKFFKYNSPKGALDCYTSCRIVKFDFCDFTVFGQLQYILSDDSTLNSACFLMESCDSKSRVGAIELNKIGKNLKFAVKSW